MAYNANSIAFIPSVHWKELSTFPPVFFFFNLFFIFIHVTNVQQRFNLGS